MYCIINSIEYTRLAMRHATAALDLTMPHCQPRREYIKPYILCIKPYILIVLSRYVANASKIFQNPYILSIYISGI
jgi:hypothetical protein